MRYSNIQSHIDSIRRRADAITIPADFESMQGDLRASVDIALEDIKDAIYELVDTAMGDVYKQQKTERTELENELELLEDAIKKLEETK